MKKILFAAIVTAAVMSCSKTEAVYTPSAEIGFVPVSKYDTKTAISGTTYTNDLPFYVYANAKDNGASTFVSKYFENALFVHESTSGTTHVYHGSPAQYWPNVNPLIFAGFTQSGNIANLVAADIANKSDVVIAPASDLTSLTISGYVQPKPTVQNVDNDFMYFFADNDDAGYTSQTTYISTVMKHACSWITINIKAETADLLTYWPNLKVKNVKFLGLHETGNVTLSESAAASWTVGGVPAADGVNVRTTEMALTTNFQEFADYANNTIVIPQALANDDATAKVQLSVTYSYTTPAGTTDFTETKVLDIFYDGDKSAWQPGKHYIYNLTVTATEIKIAPSSEDWVTDLNGNSTADDDVNKDI